MFICSPVSAEPETFHGNVRVVAPSAEQKAPRRLQGIVKKEGGKWQMAFTSVAPPTTNQPTVEVDRVNRKVTLINEETSQRTELDFNHLETARWSEIPQDAESMGAFFLIGDALKQKARFIRNTRFQNHAVQEYSFSEGAGSFGRLFYSVEFGIPLKLDVFGAGGTHTLITIENVRR